MPQLLPHIDQIAREKQRNVLTVEFHDDDSRSNIPYQHNKSRETIMAWLTANTSSALMCCEGGANKRSLNSLSACGAGGGAAQAVSTRHKDRISQRFIWGHRAVGYFQYAACNVLLPIYT